MPPGPHSRYRRDGLYRDETGVLYCVEHEPIRFAADPGNRLHRVELGDTLANIAERFFDGPHTSRFWWVIAEFQPEPIQDPTSELVVGTYLVVPSTLYLNSQILNALNAVPPVLV